MAETRQLVEIVSRIDERVEILLDKSDKFEKKLEEMNMQQAILNGRVATVEKVSSEYEKDSLEIEERLKDLELDVHALKIKTDNKEKNWSNIVSMIMGIVVGGIVALISKYFGM